MNKLIKPSIILIILIWYLGFWVGYCFGDIVDDVLPIIAMAESSNNPDAVGDNGNSVGLYQVSSILLKDFNEMTDNAYTKDDLFNVNTNRIIAIWFLHYRIIPALEKHNYPIDTVHIISLYNMGITRGLKYIKEYGIPKTHGNRIYRKEYKDYWRKKK